jgi:hypothetical protein
MIADLTRPHSVLRSAWHRLQGRPETPVEKLIQGVENSRGLPERPAR